MIYRVGFKFDGMSSGWTETMAAKSVYDNPIQLWPAVAAVALKRAQFLGREFSITGVRVSRYATDAGVRTRGMQPLVRTFANAIQTASAAAEPKEVALLVTGYAVADPLLPQFGANTNRLFLGAPLDVSVDNAGVVYEGKGGLGAAYGQWRTAVLSQPNVNFGWLVNETIANFGVSAIVQNLNGTVTITAEAGDLAALTIGQTYECRMRDVNHGKSPMNIDTNVRKATATTLITTRVIGIPTPQTGGSMRVYKQIKPFVNFAELVLGAVVGKHQRGRPTGGSRGRAPDRILG